MFLGTQTPFLRWKGRGSKGNTSIFCYSSPRLNAWSLHQKSTSSTWLQHCPEQAKVPGGQRTFPPPPPCSRHFFFFLKRGQQRRAATAQTRLSGAAALLPLEQEAKGFCPGFASLCAKPPLAGSAKQPRRFKEGKGSF